MQPESESLPSHAKTAREETLSHDSHSTTQP